MAQVSRFGIVGGLGALAGADLYAKLARAAALAHRGAGVAVALEQRPFEDAPPALRRGAGDETRKFYVYDVIRSLERREAESVLVGCFLSHGFIDEIQPHVRPRILSMVDALSCHLRHRFPGVRRVGVLAPAHVRERALLEHRLGGFELVHPAADQDLDQLAEALYGPRGVKRGYLDAAVVAPLARVCKALAEAGAEVVVPATTEIALVIDSLRAVCPVPVIDCNLVYAEYALSATANAPAPAFRLGVVGGVGPAATVDFMSKLIASTPASRDQDHMAMQVQHEPQIPDRTACLLHGGADPTIALLAACERLQAAGAHAIAIPCNTAHAFLPAIAGRLEVPVIDMPRETLRWIRSTHPHLSRVGLLATSGTVASGIYQRAAQETGIQCITPDPARQALVMEAIYGVDGVKAGFRSGPCRARMVEAIGHLAAEGAEIFILGCTEIPLLFPERELALAGGARVPLVDSAEVLARRCVQERERHLRQNRQPATDPEHFGSTK